MSTAIDAVLVLSFGGPEHSDDVLPFLRNVTRGRNVPEGRLVQVAKQYELLGGRSPINEQCRSFIGELEHELHHRKIALPVYWGNRNWRPFLADTLTQMRHDGIRNALVYVTSIFGSYSGCRQYLEDMDHARAELRRTDAGEQSGPADGERSGPVPELHKLRLFYNHPGFIDAQGAQLAHALGHQAIDPSTTIVLFSAHSLPASQAANCQYQAQLGEAARLVMQQHPAVHYEVVYQSRSGPPSMPWLEPDINDRLAQIAADGHRGDGVPPERVVVVPIGFVSDNAEVLFDLDIQAAQTAADLGMSFLRVPTVGTHPRFVATVADLIQERLDPSRPRLAIGTDGPWPDVCAPGHCLGANPSG